MLLLLGIHAAAASERAIERVPMDAVGVLTFKNLEASDGRLTKLIQTLNPRFEGLPLADLEATLGFAPGTIDLSKRLTLIFLHPDEVTEFTQGTGINDVAPFPVIAFTPKQTDGSAGFEDSPDRRIRSRQGTWCEYSYFVDDNTVFVSNRRRALRTILRTDKAQSLAAQLNVETRAVWDSCDLAAHIPMSPWRNRIAPYVAMAGNLIKLGAMAQQVPERMDEYQRILNWLVGSSTDVINQVSATTIAVQLDGEHVRLHHLHEFDRNRWFADYLANVRRGGGRAFAAFPDRPFLVVGYSDWRCPPQDSMTHRVMEQVVELPSVKRRFSEKTRSQLLEASLQSVDRLSFAEFMVCNTSPSLMPFEIYGSYLTANPSEAMETYIALYQHSNELLSFVSAGGPGFPGQFTRIRVNGIDIREMKFDEAGAPEHLIQQVKQAYGESVVFQLATDGKDHLIYSIGRPESGVHKLIEARSSGRSIEKNPRVDEVRRLLPADSNVLIITDLGRLIESARTFVGMPPHADIEASSRKDAPPTADKHPNSPETPASLLAGWSCAARKNVLCGQLVIRADALCRIFAGSASAHDKAPLRAP
ncbi:MAG: hypothetical protein KF841_06960 [Phycisphaerae bacterium]|nr:hypothetical protein [Phycisphaerae bacterium]